MGASTFLSRVPSGANPRALSGVGNLMKVLGAVGIGVEEQPAFGGSAQPPPQDGSAAASNMFLGQVMLASARQDSKAIEELTAQVDPTDTLRKLVQAAQQGEPLKELEPDESALRAAAAARKSGRFPQIELPKTDSGGHRQGRPVPQTLLDALPRIWAAALEGRCARGDPMNWVGQVALAANDRVSLTQGQIERAAAMYGQRVLHDAYCASKRGDSDAQGRENTSSILGEMNWNPLQRCQAEVSSWVAPLGGRAGNEGKGGGGQSDLTGQTCMRHLLGKCDGCKFRHGCPFCTTNAERGSALLRRSSSEVWFRALARAIAG